MNKGTKKTRRWLEKERVIAMNNSNTWRALTIQGLLSKSEKKDFTQKQIKMIN